MRNLLNTTTQTLEFPDRLYVALLALYPKGFQARFGAEMVQTFRDCRLMKKRNPNFKNIYLQTIADVLLSVPQEWRREVAKEDSEIDYTGLMDLFMITVVVGTHLLSWGLMASAIAVKALGYEPSTETFLTCVLTVAVAAGVGFGSARLVARGGRVESHRITV